MTFSWHFHVTSIPSPIELLAVEQKKRPGSRCLIFNRNEIVCFWQDLYFDSSGSLFRRGEFFVISSLVKPFYMWAQRESSSSSCQCLQIQNNILPWSPGIWNYLTHMMNASFKGFFAYPNVAPTDIGSITFGPKVSGRSFQYFQIHIWEFKFKGRWTVQCSSSNRNFCSSLKWRYSANYIHY